ncbi:hypothetical protein N7504_003934 [Penicillium tannophilum]|nr:hypothetical protein N7504_003934 [Penicillium tannophilum]
MRMVELDELDRSPNHGTTLYPIAIQDAPTSENLTEGSIPEEIPTQNLDQETVPEPIPEEPITGNQNLNQGAVEQDSATDLNVDGAMDFELDLEAEGEEEIIPTSWFDQASLSCFIKLFH